MKEEKFFKKEVRLSGSGGQGLILAGIILAKAAVLDGNKVSQTQSYGPESRGGASRADVIMSNGDIYFPEAQKFDILLALTQESSDKYSNDLKQKGLFIVDSTYVKNITVILSNIHSHPFTEIAEKELKTKLPTNILTLSYLVRASKIVSEKSLEKVIRETVKPNYIELNMKAMKLGFSLYSKFNKGRSKTDD